MPENARDKIIELLENGVIGWQAVCRECLERMSVPEISDMLHECGWDEEEI